MARRLVRHQRSHQLVEGTITAAGHQLMHPLDPSKIGLDNNRGAWVADPDGNRIELMEMAPDCVQYEAIKAFKAGKGLTSLIRPVAPRK